MNDPAPPLGRGGWVCAALLLGFFAGSGITWALLTRHAWQAPLVVYPLPPRGVAAAAPSRAAQGTPSAPLAGGTLNAAENDVPANSGGITPPLNRAVGEAAEPRQTSPVTQEAAPLDLERLPDRPSLPALRTDSNHILHSHPKAEGCFANALAALAPFTKKGFDLRDKVWEGEISLEEGKAVSCQLFKGNDYCFCVGTDAKGAKLSLQLYRSNGEPADFAQSAQELASGASATAYWRCNQTGAYFIVVKLEAATQEKVPWGMVSAYR